ENASEWNDQPGRRTFLKLMGASIALAGLTACTRQPTEHIAPYVRQPEQIVPGRPLFFATAMPLAGFEPGVSPEGTGGRQTRTKGTRMIRPVLAPPTSSRKRPCLGFTIPTGLKP